MRFPLVAIPAAAALLAGCGPRAITLPADPIERAATCSIVAAANARETSKNMGALSFDQQAQILHYALLGAAEGERFDQARAQAVTLKAQAIQEQVTGGKWKDLVQPCAAAYPQAVSTAPVTLPPGDFDARIACYQLGTFLAKAMQSGDPAVEDRLAEFGSLNRALDPKIGAALVSRGIKTDSDAGQALRDKALGEAAKLGPPPVVMSACLAKYAPPKT